ncbi:Acetyl-CoA carboxylase 1 [Seminavis robusta]|uniref:Acetyl-CoA carboxylase 1 n=1 Tax=Seminavis robusta TaxID=568900 RepID=A0A9N8EUH9_9STRA|nr:Acetyl-CoA carboxylase 1 [Seminavis robusta]|eukprot:Sro1721_g293540.1 Acetyl-CoA carboxylase 1 (2339) ;mRNA; r:11881-19230
MDRPTGISPISPNFHKRFENVEQYVSELGGDKSFVIEKVLIANNGVAAVKAIRSIRRWAYEVFGNEKAISFVVMATPEDLRANAEYIRMGDVIVDVPGGSNNHNYANVTLIVELARLHGVNAVWAGWGHASENPLLPDTLAKSVPPIKFIGPAGPPMRALGDKIGSTIIAQSAKVPCIAWNGENVNATYDRESGSLPKEAYDEASIASSQEAAEAANRIGFPIMIKASEGGGGKGIRRVDNPADVANAFRQVCGEVPGSPIFIMKLSSNSRHLEVQLLADEYGDAVALNGRDCSVQRRHQKIIEEGPPVAADPKIWVEMEKAAVALAKAVGYTNAGTVEYLYSESEAKFYFLELNPRLQVEHPVTEMITRANLPAAQLQVAMGIPLYNIPEIREIYGRNRFDDNPKDASAKIDFDNVSRVPANGHCIAVRITAENAEAGFKPTSGGIQELNFRSTPNVWGYFSMDSSGSIHEFADSQFGHLFANGPDREQARRNMVLALKELSIRGDISTTVDYISKLIELEDFVNNRIDTGWLDAIIKENVDGMAAAENVLQRRKTNVKIDALHDHMHMVIAATVVAYNRCKTGEESFVQSLEKGQLPSRTCVDMKHDVELILNGVKYKLRCTRNGPHAFSIGSSTGTESVATSVRVLSDGGYLIDIAGSSHVAYLTSAPEAATGMRINVGGANIAFSPDYDPSSLRSDVAGKLVKRLVGDGAHVRKGEVFAEVEVMKMFMPLKVDEAGVLSWNVNEGAALAPGDLLATLELDNPDNVSTVELFEGDLNLNLSGQASATASTRRAHLLFRGAIEKLNGAVSGYVLSDEAIERAISDLASAVMDPELPLLEIDEQLSVLSGRIPGKLFDGISSILQDQKTLIAEQAGSGVQVKFPAKQIIDLLQAEEASFTDASEQSAFHALTTPLRDAVVPYTKSKAAGVPGSERALHSFLSLLRKWVAVERWFYDASSYADAVESLRKAHKNDFVTVLEVCRSHEQLKLTSSIVKRIVSAIGDGYKLDPETSNVSPIGKRVSVVAGAESLSDAIPAISEIGSMGNKKEYSDVALKARKLLMQQSMPSFEERKAKVLEAVAKLTAADGAQSTKEVDELLADQTPMVDVFFPLLTSVSSSSEKVGLLELYVRNFYRTYSVKMIQRNAEDSLLKFTFMNKRSESAIHSSTSVTSMSDLTRIMSSSASLSNLGAAEDSVLSMDDKEKIPPQTLRTGVFAVVDKFDDLVDPGKFSSVLQQFPSTSSSDHAPFNVLYFVVLCTSVGSDEGTDESISKKATDMLSQWYDVLKSAGIRRVTLLFKQEQDDEFEEYRAPVLFTFRSPDFQEDSIYRRIDPSHALHLDLNRVAANFRVRSLGSRHTSTCQVHLYEGTPRSSALAKDKKANRAARVFVRALSFVLDFSSSSFERILVDALNALDLCATKSTTDNHLFINLVSDYEKAVLDPVVVEQVVVDILKRHGERVSNLGIVEVEARIVCCLSLDSPPIALRLVASNPTGFVHVMSTYVEAAVESGTERIFKLIGGTKASLASTGDSSWEGLNVDTPYPLTRPFDAQRNAAQRSSDTLYCYDVPALFEAAVEQQWATTSTLGGINGGIRAASRPLMVMYTTELVVKRKDGSGSWTMEDYINGELELQQINRGAGANDVGMVAWLMVLKTVEYPNGRQVVLIANDITHKAGSFGTREDVVFKMASEYARHMRIPRIYIAANSGARIGLASEVKKRFKVAFKDPAQPETGFDFLYVTKEDYEDLNKGKQQIMGSPTSYNGQSVYQVTDIIGAEPDLGVENLKGSGLIAGETSVAYDEIFTMTIVLGRTVGIGAYLVRLGQRTIQRMSASPIILTGYQALNKLMGVDVYSTNDQLGGPGIMYPNGISHMVEPDHLRAVKSAIDWLSYVPSVRGGLLPVADIRGYDEIERPVSFCPSPGATYDPRALIAGGEDDSGVWQSGFFDKGSFTEALAGWAKTVVVGRARLGGIPMGVIITENRTAEAVKPADPADVKASEAVIQEAGCVWFPNSAYKTAQAIKDFRTEDLPLIVFANWRGFSGGQRDMFDEVLKYGSLIVDAFVSYEQPVFVFIPPFAEIRGGAWVVLDASINASVMEMYASSKTARGGVLEANGAASVKYRTPDLIVTMHRLDDQLIALDSKLASESDDAAKSAIKEKISKRESALLPVYEQIAVQFCELHDTPGRMKAVGVIHREVEWKESRTYFYWRLRRKLAEFDLRKKLVEASQVGRSVKTLSPLEASAVVKQWFLETAGMDEAGWDNDKLLLSWMGERYAELEQKVLDYTKRCVAEEVVQVMTSGGNTAVIGTAGIVQGVGEAYKKMDPEQKAHFMKMLKETLQMS